MASAPDLLGPWHDVLLAEAPVGIFVTDPQGECRYVNHRWCELAGLTPDEARGQEWARALHPDDRERVFREWQEAAEQGREFASEYRFRTPAGVVTWVEGRSALLRAPDGAIRGYIGTVTDVDARKRANEALRRSDAPFRRLYESNIVGVIFWDFVGNITQANDCFLEMVGYSREELLAGRIGWLAMTPPEWEEVDRRAVELLRTVGASPPFEKEYVRRDGSRVPIIVAPAVLPDEPQRGVAFILDIGDRKRAEQERAALLEREQAARGRAEAAERRAAFLAGASQELAASLDFETTLASVARLAVPDFADWCIVDLLEEDGSIRSVAGAADPTREPWLRQLQQIGADPDIPHRARVLREGAVVLIPEFSEAQVQASARSEHHLEVLRALDPRSVLLVPLRARGRTLGSFFLASSRPDRRYGPAEQALAEDLAGRCALAIDNARLYREAQDAISLRDEFLTIASHELRTPLTTLQAHVQLILRRAEREGGLDPERVLQALRTITRQTDRLTRLIAQLLDISRLEAGRLALERLAVDLGALVAEAAGAAQARTTEHRVTLRAAGPIPAEVDPLRLEQALSNLLENAIKYSPDGGEIEVVLRAGDGGRRESPTPNSHLPTPDDIVISVRDHGIGIPPEQRGRIFERFHRAHAESRYSGMGLGLYISRQIVELHGGELAVDFPEDGGTRFVVRLPAR